MAEKYIEFVKLCVQESSLKVSSKPLVKEWWLKKIHFWGGGGGVNRSCVAVSVFGAVYFSMTKMLVLPDSRNMYKSFGT